MKIVVVILFLTFFAIQFSEAEIHVDNADELNPELTQSSRNLTSTSSKLHPVIAAWQTSLDQKTFAKNNNLSFSDNKITVYIHLDSAESISDIPKEIDVASSDQNIAVAFVSSTDLDELSQLDFVVRISLPDKARTPPLPTFEEKTEPNDPDFIFVILGSIIAVAVIIGCMYVFRNKSIIKGR